MSRTLAIEWDNREARIVVGNLRGRSLVVEQAFAVDLAPSAPGESLDAEHVGERIAAALAARRIGRSDALIAVGRSNIELRRLALPPAPQEELPDMVRFQAKSEFSSLTDEWSIDFAPLTAQSGETTNVLAAAISPKLLSQIKQTCEAAGVTAERLALRPFAAASLLSSQGPVSGCQLLVDLLSDEADLTVLIDESVVFVRTVRLTAPGDMERRAASLVGEIRRTMAAAQNQLEGRQVERVTLCGDGEEHGVLRQRVEEKLDLPTEVFDPFSAAALGGELKAEHPDQPGRFAPLLGLLVDEAAGRRPAIDFLQPRQRPIPPDRRRIAALATAGVLAIAGLAAFWIWSNLAAMDREVANLKSEVGGLEATLEAANVVRIQAEEIDDFVRGDVFWLAELRDLSQEFGQPEEAMITRLTMTSLNEDGGQIQIEGRARDSAAIRKLETALKDKRHEVIGGPSQYDDSNPDYPWRLNATVVVAPTEIEDAPPQENAP